jgi:phosphoserine phosphatase
MSSDEVKSGGDLHKVLEIVRRMAATTELLPLLELIVETSCQLLDAERGSVLLYEPATGELVSRVATGVVQEIRFPAGRGIAGATIQAARTLHVPDAQADPRFNPEVDRRTGFHTREIVSVPLRDHEEQLVGVLQVLNRRRGSFSEADIALAEAFAAQAGVALQRARLLEQYVAKQQMERSMRIAREIQQNLLPAGPPAAAGFDIAGFSRPADETGGDAYDFLDLGAGRWMLTVADAAGHGIGPALVIAETRAMLRTACRLGCDVPTVLATVNALLAADLKDGRFVTCFLGVLDTASGELAYTSAGHGPLLFYDRATDAFTQQPAAALPLGISPVEAFTKLSVRRMAPGDFAAVTTDGFFEAEDAGGAEFGIGRVIEVLRTARDLPAAEMIERLRAAVDAHAAGCRQADDRTAVVIRRR